MGIENVAKWLFRSLESDESNPEWREDDQLGEDIRFVENIFIHHFESRLRKYSLIYIPVFSLLFGDLLLGYITNCQIIGWGLPNQTYGLVLDAVGAIVIARGIFRGPYQTVRESTTALRHDSSMSISGQPIPYFEDEVVTDDDRVFSPTRREAMTKSAVDGVFGTLFLVSGFAIQLSAVVAPTIAPYLPTVPCL